MTFLINPKGIEVGVVLVAEGGQETYIQNGGAGWDKYLDWVSLGNTAAAYPAPAPASAEDLQKAEIAAKIKKMNHGREVVALVTNINETKQLSAEDYIAMVSDVTMSQARALLEAGALDTGKAIIAATPWAYYNAEDVAKIVSFIESFVP